MPRKIEISHKTIVFILILLGLVWFVMRIMDIILLFFVSVILMSALNPAVDGLEKKRIPRWLSITFLYIVVIGSLSIIVASLVPPLVEQTSHLVSQLPSLAQTLNFLNLDARSVGSQLSSLSSLPGDIVKFTAGLFSNILYISTVAVMTFYLLMERRNLQKYLSQMFGQGSEKKVESLINRVENQLGSWVRGQLILMTAIGLISFLGLSILGVPYALPLALVAGLLEVVPTVGPILSAIPATLAGFIITPYTAIGVVALYFAVQQAENSFLVPKIMQKTTGVNPLVSLLSLMIGFKLAGPAGAILSIPLLLIGIIAVTEMTSSKRFEDF